MNISPLVSVVIPLYNGEIYIKETIESVLRQTYSNIEIIVVDDGSRDNSPAIVKEMQIGNPSIRYVNQQNQGVAAARNTGIVNATGEYIAFLDSDDLWHPTKLEKQMNSMASNQMSVCYCGYINFYEKTGEKAEVATSFLTGDATVAFLTHRVLAQTGTWVIKKDILIQHGIIFTPGASWAEDVEFFFKVMSVAPVCSVAEYLVDYRIQAQGNLSSKHSRYNIKTEKELAAFSRMRNWILQKKEHIIHDDIEELLRLIDTYIMPYTITNNACIYFKSNEDITSEQCSQIKRDLSRYAKKVYLRNGKRSLKVLLKRAYVQMQLLRKG